MKSLNKKAAIELSIGTIVIIVLAMSMLILGLVLVRTIFTSSIDNIKKIDDKVKDEIDKIFSEESDKKVALYPGQRIRLKQGERGGFGFSIRNTGMEGITVNWKIEFVAAERGCKIKKSEAESYLLIKTGKINLGAGQKLNWPQLVDFSIPETAPPCLVSYNLNTDYSTGGTFEPSVQISVTLMPK